MSPLNMGQLCCSGRRWILILGVRTYRRDGDAPEGDRHVAGPGLCFGVAAHCGGSACEDLLQSVDPSNTDS